MVVAASPQIIKKPTPAPRHFDRSEAEWRNLTPKCSKPMVAGDLSAQSFHRPQNLCHSYRRVPPLEMTMPAGSIQSFAEEQIDPNAALTAKRRPAWMEWSFEALAV